MRKGGYKILDLKGNIFDVTGEPTAVTIPGIYDAIEGCTKPFMVSGFAVKYGDSDTVEYKDIILTFISLEGMWVGETWLGEGKTLTVLVSDEDGVYILPNEYKRGSELPENPEDDGTYTLKATVAEGEVTLSWVKDTEATE